MSELNAHELSRFHDPEEMHAKVIPETLGIQNDVFFRGSDPKYQKFREAWAASLLTRGLFAYIGPCEVRLYDGDFPDFEIQARKTIHQFEFTEVLELGYRRGDEYGERKTDRVRAKDVRFAHVEEAAEWICEGIQKKAKKRYGPSVHLLVYADFWVSDAVDLGSVRRRCRRYKPAFKSMWLLFGIGIAQLFPSDDFGEICQEWSEIPGYLEESKRRMGIKDV